MVPWCGRTKVLYGTIQKGLGINAEGYGSSWISNLIKHTKLYFVKLPVVEWENAVNS